MCTRSILGCCQAWRHPSHRCRDQSGTAVAVRGYKRTGSHRCGRGLELRLLRELGQRPLNLERCFGPRSWWRLLSGGLPRVPRLSLHPSKRSFPARNWLWSLPHQRPRSHWSWRRHLRRHRRRSRSTRHVRRASSKGRFDTIRHVHTVLKHPRCGKEIWTGRSWTR